MKKIIASFTIIFFCLTASVSGLAAERSESYLPEKFSDFHADELKLYAKSAVLIDADTGRILYGKSADTPMANASTTKILTCILAIENASMDDVVTVSDYACSMPKVRLGFSSGDTFYLRDLLYSLMLESHNDSAVAIAEHVAGSVEAFAVLMNKKAEEIGCRNSHFVTPNGLDREDESGTHQTTAYDLSMIMSYCIQNPEFLDITQTKNRQISTLDNSKSYSLSNHNAFLQMMEGALSGKTGFTAKAGYCYVGAYTNGDHTYTFALLACGWPNNKNYKWSDARSLIEYANEHYTDQVIAEGTAQKELPLLHAVKSEGDTILHPESITVQSSGDAVSAFVSDTDQIQIKYNLPEAISAPVTEGQSVGTEVIYLNDMKYGERDMKLTESVEAYDFRWCLRYTFRSLDL